MKILCAISGIQFQCDHFPAELASRETTHPIFHLKQKKLLSYITKHHAGELTSTDSYLLFLSLLNSTELVDWSVPVVRTDRTNSLVALNMDKLVSLVSQINLIKTPALALPSFIVSSETKSLDNVHYWLESWADALEEFKSNYKSTTLLASIRQREALLEKSIKNTTKDISTYANILAEWASLAGSFPTFMIVDPNGVKLPLADYWKSIIKRCCRSESIFEVPTKDIQELIEHCEDNIPHGSIYANSLMKLLRTGLVKKTTFLSDDDVTTGDTFVILDASQGVEAANKLLLINSAPKEKPVESDYPNRFAYIKAKLKYDMATTYNKKLAEHQATTNYSESEQ